ncbi:ABC transporter substrate-binding protein [Ornithinibacillus sp. 4-3]|uniref:ABC transporter substrate-binding protein n=1 Tax=Ornithinibacillus sp. 4-3 TaxID=3231488 RepID=A0AB39HM80_9BACI
MKFIKKSLIFYFLILGLTLVACQSNDSEEVNKEINNEENKAEDQDKDQEKNNDTARKELRIAYNAQPPTLDTYISVAGATRQVASQIFESLVTLDSNYVIQPMLAESYEESEDGKTITFHLRQGIKFHNGEEMKADDVVASMERWFSRSSVGKANFSDATIDAEDEYTVVINLSEYSFLTLYFLANPTQLAGITTKENAESADEALGIDEMIGTGPFKFEEWKQDQYIHLSKFDEYSSRSEQPDGFAGGKEVLIDDLYFEFVSDSSTRVAGMLSGEYDIATTIPFDNVDQLEKDSNVEIQSGEVSFTAMIFNKKAGVFSDQKIRQAVNAALDMEEILMAAFGSEDYYELQHGLMIEDQIEWHSEKGKENYNINDTEKAKQLLQEAGYDGEEITVMTSRDYPEMYDASVVAQQQLNELGMNIKLEIYDWPTVIELREDPSAYDAFFTVVATEPFPNAFYFLDSANEYAGWTDSPEIDDLLNKITQSRTQEEAAEIFGELQEEFWDYLPLIRFGDSKAIRAHRNNVQNVRGFMGLQLWNVDKEE